MSLSRRHLLAGSFATATVLILPVDAEAKPRRRRAPKIQPKPAAPAFDMAKAANVPLPPETGEGTVCVAKPSLLLDAAKAREARAIAPPPNYVIQDLHGNVLKSSFETVRRHNASTTKMLLLDGVMRMMKTHPIRFNMGSAVEIPVAVKELKHDLFALSLHAGKSYKVKDLMIACGSFSCARATLALTAHLGRFLGGDTEKDRIDRAIQHLNETAQLHGMKDTNIRNSIGAPDKQHYSTAIDMAKLSLIMERDFPETSREVMGQAYPLTVWGPRHHTSGWLRTHPDEIKFCKTGTTNAAGRCLAGVATSKGQDFGFAIFGAGTSGERDTIMTRIYNVAAAYKPPVIAKPYVPQETPSFVEWGMDVFGLMPR